jgi:hypothetical protein
MHAHCLNPDPGCTPRPPSFIKLFQRGRTLSMLSLAVFFQSVGELRFTFDIGQIIWRNVHKVGR